MSDARPNQLCLWRDCVLYLGDSFDPEMHRHHAVQCCIALKGEIRIRLEEEAEWQSCYSAVIGANVSHSISNPDGALGILYLEKASNDYRSILDFHGISGTRRTQINPLVSSTPVSAALLTALNDARSMSLDTSRATELREDWLHYLHGQLSPAKKVDRRISAVLASLHECPGRLFAGKELANVAGLSESRMQHLFKKQIGIPIRRYVLWMRMRHVVELAVSGTTLTSAAHAAGFSDLAHFTRTFRAMFGIKPSALLSGGSGLVPLLCDRPEISIRRRRDPLEIPKHS